ncbi:HD domain-containing protein [Peribacillus asahii]|uniref:HD domain-containing protein n=1 Tax=Peribacillus asahii TaxID=228899 RepID=UPI00207A115F|nr:hypothetical protein [Peribacillus asahii]USK86182.1 hypothetical protein LIT35_05940 [Peribacillus asahii]
MSSVLLLTNVKDTTLWKKLDQDFLGSDKEVASILATNLLQICQQSYNRMKYFSSLHPQYTLHDETHFLRVTELMAKIMPKDVLDNLNPIELALLILSAHYHDQGMVLDDEELNNLKKDPNFNLFKENWTIEHPNYKEIINQIESPSISTEKRQVLNNKEQELYGALLTDYIRETHGQRSANYVNQNYSNNDLWNIIGTNLADYVAKLCKSHVLPTTDINSQNGFYHDESVGSYQVNMVYLAIILRLADILDFDRDRTPDILYKTIHFTNEVSLIEWAKHRSVEGWVISPDKIRFTLKCEHPVYEKAAREFMDWIDQELVDVSALIRKFPKEIAKYYLSLPQSVDRSRIEPKNNEYIYHDLEFSLSRNEIVKLLMTDNLYKSTSLCIRELLQNALDALRYRKALIKRDNDLEWNSGQVNFTHSLDDHGREVIECVDNGIGMDIGIITRFLTKAGRSYYRSPEFERERASFASHGVDFDPCAQFGIGFMSCFMLGDEIIIKTRKDYGPNMGWGDPLIVEVNGLSGIIVIRKGENNQAVGTSVKIISRKKPDYFDEFEDRVRLIDVLGGYALATEFPITGNCTISEIEDSIEVPITISKTRTEIEQSLTSNFVTIEQEFSEINQNLQGQVRASFLIDEENKINLKNQDAYWKKDENDIMKLFVNNSKARYTREGDSSTCIDGILVCGEPGHTKARSRLGWYSNVISLGGDSFTMDIRGSLKPPLTTERIPPDSARNSQDFKWKRIQNLALIAQGRLWDKIIDRLNGENNNGNIFWKLVLIHRPDLLSFAYKTLFTKVYFPIIDENGNIVRWNKANEIEYVEIIKNKNSFDLKLKDGNFIGEYSSLKEWKSAHSGYNVDWLIKVAIISMTVLTKKDGKLIFEIREPSELEKAPCQNWVNRSIPIIQYSSMYNHIIGVDLPIPTLNANHPLTKVILQTIDSNELNSFQALARSLVSFNGIIKDSKNNNIWLRRIGYYFKAIDWENVIDELKPPYKFLKMNEEAFILTEEEFKRWAEFSPERIFMN